MTDGPAPTNRDRPLSSADGTTGHRTKSHLAADEIRKRILGGEYPPGLQLRQDTMAAEMGMSRIPIREALVLLESEGIVRIAPHRGAVVTALSLEEIDELFNMRMLLEPFLLRRSAPHLGRADFEALDAMVERYAASLHAAEAAKWNDLNLEFHTYLYRHAQSPRILSTVVNLLKESDRHTRLQLSNIPGGRERAVAEHRELVQLCRLSTFGAAAELMEEHIRQIGAALTAFLQNEKRNAAAR